LGCAAAGRGPSCAWINSRSLWVRAAQNQQWDCLQKLVNAKGEIAANEYFVRSNIRDRNPRTGTCALEYWKTMKVNLGLEVLEEMKPCWILDQAKAGTLKVDCDIDADFMDQSQQLTPLMMAAASGHHELVRKLIEERADVNKCTNEGLTALSFAADCGFIAGTNQCFELLLNARAEVDQRVGKTYKREFHRLRGMKSVVANAVCRIGDLEKLDLLLKAKADINLANEIGVPPLFEAAFSGNHECVQRLLAAKADMHHQMHAVRWPDYKGPMCICSFLDMHAEKTLACIQQMREIFGFPWDHIHHNGPKAVSLFQQWCIMSTPLEMEDSIEAIAWCWDSGMPITQWFYKNGRLNTMNQQIVFSVVPAPEKADMMFKVWDRKALPTDRQYVQVAVNDRMDGLEMLEYKGRHGTFNMSRMLYGMWNDYQVLLAARGEGN